MLALPCPFHALLRRRIAPALLLLALSSVSPDLPAQTPPAPEPGLGLKEVHAGLGVLALATFSSSLVIGAASGNLGKLMDPGACCPDGGDRDALWRGVDRALVTTGIVAYSSAAALAAYRLLLHEPPSEQAALAELAAVALPQPRRFFVKAKDAQEARTGQAQTLGDGLVVNGDRPRAARAVPQGAQQSLACRLTLS